MPKALLVFSGGLDSMLAAKILQEQNIEVTALCFESNFYHADKAKETAKELGIELRTVNIRDEMLDLAKSPPHGYGKNMNPCIDCHSMMFRMAGKVMREEAFDILATGEVLGQRPFSQNKDALKKVEQLAEVEVLRPLSAKLLPKTDYENKGLVNRGKLHRAEGRSRDYQMDLVEKYGIKTFPSPAGGCLLTDPEYANRLMDMLDNWPDCKPADIDLLKNGRIFWSDNNSVKKVFAVVARDKDESEALEKLAKQGDIMIRLKEMNGPTTLVRGLTLDLHKSIKVNTPEKIQDVEMKTASDEEVIKKMALLTSFYAVKARGQENIVEIKTI